MLGMRRDKKRQNGFAVIYVALIGAFVLIPMAGLAIDFGVVYNVKAQLQTACDGAAIGAGYLLHDSTDLTNQTQYNAIVTAAQQFFNANYSTHYMGSTVTSYSAVPSSSASGKTVTVNATAQVPMLFMRVLGIANSQVAATAVSNVRFIAMMIVVDRSGSVKNEGADSTIKSALSTFVANSTTSYLVNAVDTVGMISFGSTWKLDFAPSKNFQSGGSSTISTAITNLPFDTQSSTNTGEGLYQAWYQLYQMNLPGSLNVIVLLTDGRPSAFTGYFTPSGSTTCSNKSQRGASYDTFVSLGSSYPFWPPPTSGNDSYGLFTTQYAGTPETSHFAANSTNCYYATTNTNLYKDFSGATFPTTAGPVDNVGTGSGYPPGLSVAGTAVSTQSGYYTAGTNIQNPKNGRYAAFNYADNIAKLIRKDTTLKPMMFVIGLNYSGTSTEPLDEDFLAHLANDPTYVTQNTDTDAGITPGHSVYQSGQTAGMYCNSTTATLTACFQQVTNALLRLTQ